MLCSTSSIPSSGDRDLKLFALAAAGVLVFMTLFFYKCKVYDLATAAFVSLALGLMARGKLLQYLGMFALANFNRETTLPARSGVYRLFLLAPGMEALPAGHRLPAGRLRPGACPARDPLRHQPGHRHADPPRGEPAALSRLAGRQPGALGRFCAGAMVMRAAVEECTPDPAGQPGGHDAGLVDPVPGAGLLLRDPGLRRGLPGGLGDAIETVTYSSSGTIVFLLLKIL